MKLSILVLVSVKLVYNLNMSVRFTNRIIVSLMSIISLFLVTTVNAAEPTTISYDYTYGLYGGGKNFYLQSGTALYRERQGDTMIEVNFPVTAKEMSSLYAMTRLYNFNGIKTKGTKVYDRGGDKITVTANGKTITKSNAGQSIIDGEFSRIRYDRITSNLQSFVKKKLATQYRLFFIELESAYATYQPRVALDGAEVRLSGGEGDLPLLPGQHQVTVALYNDKGRNVKAEVFLITTPGDHIARIQVRGEDISLTTE